MMYKISKNLAQICDTKRTLLKYGRKDANIFCEKNNLRPNLQSVFIVSSSSLPISKIPIYRHLESAEIRQHILRSRPILTESSGSGCLTQQGRSPK